MTAHILMLISGYPMAKNLRAKISAEDTLFVHDVNTAATKRFLEEHPQGVLVAANVRELAKKAVCLYLSSVKRYRKMMN
jgi:hypothetical protein